MTTSTPEIGDLQRALELHSRGDFDAAAAHYEAILKVSPNDIRLITQLGVLRLQQGHLGDASGWLDRALELGPLTPEPNAWKGELLRRQGECTQAIPHFHRALRARRDYAPAWFNLGLAYRDADRPDEARRAWLDFLRLRPNDRRVRRELGLLAFDRREYPEALQWFREQLALEPGELTAACDVASTHLRMRNWDAAYELMKASVTPSQSSARASLLLGQALFGQGRIAESVVHLAEAHAADADNVDAAFDLGLAHDRLANLQSAIRCFKAAMTLAPDRANIVAALAVAELNLGNLEESISHHRKAVELDRSSPSLHSALLMAMHYVRIDPKEMLLEHQEWAKRHASFEALTPSDFLNAPDPDRKLRIGFLSPRFANGPLAHFFLPVLRALDRTRFSAFCYMVSDAHDSATGAMRALCDAWRDVHALSDVDLTEAIRNDQVDVLFDMAGHTPGNRLAVFARRAAPIQISWLDYDDTTGVPAMDYYLSDPYLTPPSGSQLFTETVIRPASVRAPHAHMIPVPPPGPLPLLSRGYVTFGCINRISKIGPEVVATWSAILRATPGARLLLQAAAFSSIEPADTLRERFASHGISRDRLDLRPFSDESAMLRVYQEIDVALDPFPYNGCNTTCDALSMGVPVVTLEGTSLCGRHGTAILAACRLREWIAQTNEAYIERACRAVADKEHLSKLRATLPDRFRQSLLCDNRGFVNRFEATIVQLWSSWCRSRLASSAN